MKGPPTDFHLGLRTNEGVNEDEAGEVAEVVVEVVEVKVPGVVPGMVPGAENVGGVVEEGVLTHRLTY